MGNLPLKRGCCRGCSARGRRRRRPRSNARARPLPVSESRQQRSAPRSGARGERRRWTKLAGGSCDRGGQCGPRRTSLRALTLRCCPSKFQWSPQIPVLPLQSLPPSLLSEDPGRRTSQDVLFCEEGGGLPSTGLRQGPGQLQATPSYTVLPLWACSRQIMGPRDN